MRYSLEFKKSALKEWNKLGATIQKQFTKKLKERLESPCVQTDKLSGSHDLYKIKLRQSGYRLVYKIEHQIVTVVVVAIGKRERNQVYNKAIQRLNG